MSRNKLRLPPFVPMTWQMLKSDAYLSLKANSAKALPFFLGKGKVKHSLIEFSFSYTEAGKLGFSRTTFARVVKDLIKSGFVKVVKHGGLRGYELSYTKYKLIDKWTSIHSGITIDESKNGS